MVGKYTPPLSPCWCFTVFPWMNGDNGVRVYYDESIKWHIYECKRCSIKFGALTRGGARYAWALHNRPEDKFKALWIEEYDEQNINNRLSTKIAKRKRVTRYFPK